MDNNNNASSTNTILIVIVLLILVGLAVWFVRGGFGSSATETGNETDNGQIDVNIGLPNPDDNDNGTNDGGTQNPPSSY